MKGERKKIRVNGETKRLRDDPPKGNGMMWGDGV